MNNPTSKLPIIYIISLWAFTSGALLSQSDPSIELEGLDSAFIQLENGQGSQQTMLENSIEFRTTDSEDTKAWRWSHRANDNSLALHYHGFKSRPVLHLSPNGDIGFGTDDPQAHFDFRALSNATMEFNSASSKFLSIHGGVQSSIHHRNYGILEFGADDKVFLTLKPWEVEAEKMHADDALILQVGPDIFSQWWIHTGDFFCSQFNNKALIFSSFINGFAGAAATISGDNGDFCEVSDRRFKKRLVPLPSNISAIYQLIPYRYHYRHQSDTAPPSIGYSAQEVAGLFPEAVKYNSSSDEYQLAYSPFHVLAIKAFQQEQKNVDQLSMEISDLGKILDQMLVVSNSKKTLK